jgi:hypothetical protein
VKIYRLNSLRSYRGLGGITYHSQIRCQGTRNFAIFLFCLITPPSSRIHRQFDTKSLNASPVWRNEGAVSATARDQKRPPGRRKPKRKSGSTHLRNAVGST